MPLLCQDRKLEHRVDGTAQPNKPGLKIFHWIIWTATMAAGADCSVFLSLFSAVWPGFTSCIRTQNRAQKGIALRQINANINFMSNYEGIEAALCSSYESKRPLGNGRPETVWACRISSNGWKRRWLMSAVFCFLFLTSLHRCCF